MARDGRPMLARLSAQYRIDGVPEDQKASDFFMQAIERIPSPTEIIIKSINAKNGTRTAHVEMRYGADLVRQKTFHFDAQTKLLASDLFRLAARAHGAT